MHADDPFTDDYSQRLLFVTEAWRIASARLDEGLGKRERVMVVVGEEGVGKTTLVHAACVRWSRRANVAVVTQAPDTRLALLSAIASGFGADVTNAAQRAQLLERLDAVLDPMMEEGRVPVLVFEDAHELSVDLLDELTQVVNHAIQSRRPLEVILIGRPALDATIADPSLSGLRQRIAARCALEPLTKKDTRHYLHRRVIATGGDGPKAFPRKTAAEVHERSGGIPRMINAFATDAMRLAHADHAGGVTAAHVRAASPSIAVSQPLAPPVAAPVPTPPPASSAPPPPPPPATPAAPPVAAKPASAPSPPPAEPAPSAASFPRDPSADEWVKRFVGAGGPPRIGAAFDVVEEPVAEITDELEAATRPPSGTRRLIVLDDLPDDVPSTRPVQRMAPPRRTRRRSRRGTSPVSVTVGLFVIAGLSGVLVFRHLQQHAPVNVAVAQTASVQPEAEATPPPARITPVKEKHERPAPPKTSAPAAAVAATPTPARSSEPNAAPADSATETSGRPRLALRVGSYLDLDRAQAERDRIAALAGVDGWVVSTPSGDYAVVLGIFRGQERAEAAASALLERGWVTEARVVPVPPRSARR